MYTVFRVLRLPEIRTPTGIRRGHIEGGRWWKERGQSEWEVMSHIEFPLTFNIISFFRHLIPKANISRFISCSCWKTIFWSLISSASDSKTFSSFISKSHCNSCIWSSTSGMRFSTKSSYSRRSFFNCFVSFLFFLTEGPYDVNTHNIREWREWVHEWIWFNHVTKKRKEKKKLVSLPVVSWLSLFSLCLYVQMGVTAAARCRKGPCRWTTRMSCPKQNIHDQP